MSSPLLLAFLSGLSFCLSTWVVPNIVPPGTPPKVTIRQFSATISRGGRFLQPSSRILAASLLYIFWVTLQSSDQALAGCWRYWATCLAILVPLAPYEIYFIFPINEQILRMDALLDGSTHDVKQVEKLRDSLRKWQLRNLGRVILPLLASLVGLRSLVSV